MKKFGAITLSMLLAWSVSAKDKSKEEVKGYEFTTIKEIPHTSVKNQFRSGTCWSFSALSFMESELMRMGKPELDLSEMFVVNNCYKDKAEKYVRLHGNLNFAAGGAFHDITYVWKKYGIVPESAYNGLNIGEENHIHGEMDEVLKDMVSGVIKNRNKKLSPAWKKAFDNTVDSYLGELPASFEYEGKTYTPRTFADEFCGLNPADYVEISSYTHHPFYTTFEIEVPDNWLWDKVYNVPQEELIQIIDEALKNGYSVAWAADVSEKGFATKTKGIAVVPDVDYKEMSDSEISKWENMSSAEKNSQLYKLDKPGAEKTITQEMRQEAYDNYQTTDDHGMHIVGLVKDQNGTEYYKVKNSWGEYNKYDGYFYASKAFVAYKTMDIMIHKNGIPKSIRKKLDL
ncbi:aminopeptidase [Puteibacter caeruleilacunae]|nr:aminopeptidase [Puteibacter caeruleilacunae]